MKIIRIILLIYFKFKYCYSTSVVIQQCTMLTQLENRPNTVKKSFFPLSGIFSYKDR
jgi:hypothetical protein